MVARTLDSIEIFKIMLKIKLLCIFVISVAVNVIAQNISVLVCDEISKEPLIGVNIYSSKRDTCYNTDFYGLIYLNLTKDDSFQLEYTGYRILHLAGSQLEKMDTVFIHERINTDPLSQGIGLIQEEERAWKRCKCCKKH
jgi:hypothetical protein